MTTSFPPELAQWITILGDHLIPRECDMPSFSEAGSLEEGLPHVLDIVPSGYDMLRRAMASAQGTDPHAVAESLERQETEVRNAVHLIVAASYYSRPVVRQALKYTGQVPGSLNMNEFLSIIEEGLLEPVIERGPIYREAKVEEATKKET